MASRDTSPKKQSRYTAPLVVYNFVSCSLWTFHLIQTLRFIAAGDLSKVQAYFSKTQNYLTAVQCLAVVEIFNSLFKIVRSPLFTTAAQISSRLLIVIGSFKLVPQIREEIGVEYLTLSVAWGLTEAVRYAFYGLNLLKIKSNLVTLLRYNMFPVLYPLGVCSELIILYKTMELCENTLVKGLYLASMLVYIPGFPILFAHICAQRTKAMKEFRGEVGGKKTN